MYIASSIDAFVRVLMDVSSKTETSFLGVDSMCSDYTLQQHKVRNPCLIVHGNTADSD